MGTKVKICGLRRIEDIQYVNEAMPDLAGFIFDSSRRRYIDPQKAAGLRAELAPGIKAVGVFVNAPAKLIIDTIKTVRLDAVQFHGNESEEFIRQAKMETGLPIIKAFRISSAEDLEKACASSADMILLDNGKGGTGKSFDWSLLKDVPRDFMLAGGLGPDNAAEAVRTVRPWGLDASSGLEIDGFKDYDKIIEFMDAVRSTDE